MKKLLTTLVLFSALLLFKSYAQSGTTGCIPDFTFQFLTSTTVKLNPTLTTDSPYVQHYWSFGDGSPASNRISPHHNYSPGLYTIKHFVVRHNPNGVVVCTDSLLKQLTIGQTNCNLVAAFTSTTSAPLQVAFNNTSTGFTSGDSIRWTFGDGTVSYHANPTHQYANAGTYTVCLRVKKAANLATTAPCVSEVCHTVTVSLPPNPCNFTANFTWNHDITGLNIYNYHFTNTSAGSSATDSFRWTFGDGTSSNQLNPVHGYNAAGVYNVCIRIIKRNSNGVLTNCVAEKCYTITVVPACTLQAKYTRTVSTTNYKTINFTNTSNATPNTATATWYFGDGSTTTTWNASHTYNLPGSYNVCLRVQSGNCVSYKCDSVRVVEPTPACNAQSAYSYVRSATNNNILSFTPAFISNDVQYTWTFGDGTGTQTTVGPTHQFAAIGSYNVCLTVFRNNSCASTTCKTICVSSTTNCSAITLGINDVRDPLVPNRVTFVATSNTAITDQLWTITKLPTTSTTGTATIHSNNPTYVFLDPGYYNVCVRTTYAGGCVKELCKTIHITQQMPFTTTCNLQVTPNPATTYANVSITLAQPTMLYGYVYNSMNMLVAQKVQQGFVGTNTVSVFTGNLPSGMYRLRLVHGNDVCNANFVR